MPIYFTKQVLYVSKNERLNWEWAYGKEIPENAITCTDDQLGTHSNKIRIKTVFGHN